MHPNLLSRGATKDKARNVVVLRRREGPRALGRSPIYMSARPLHGPTSGSRYGAVTVLPVPKQQLTSTGVRAPRERMTISRLRAHPPKSLQTSAKLRAAHSLFRQPTKSSQKPEVYAQCRPRGLVPVSLPSGVLFATRCLNQLCLLLRFFECSTCPWARAVAYRAAVAHTAERQGGMPPNLVIGRCGQGI